MENKKIQDTIVSSIRIPALTLESGEILKDINLVYERSGNINGPVILICHALTGNHLVSGDDDQPGWWAGLVGPGCYIDTNEFQIISFNVLGGCDGSTGPASLSPITGKRYGPDFPEITIRDMVSAQHTALQTLGIKKLEAVIGGSLGGMQALEWGLMFPQFVQKIFPLAVTPELSDYGIAFNHIGIRSIENDPHWNNGYYEENCEIKGLEIARMAGMVTYRTGALFAERFTRGQNNQQFEVQSYLDYQGNKLRSRFDANSYLTLLRAMNTHDIKRGREDWKELLANLPCELIGISYDGDLIYEQASLKVLTEIIPDSTHYFIPTVFGHDGFLVEFEKWGGIIQSHLTKLKVKGASVFKY
ncbi:homoserine O-acetyltransferase MetX [Bacillus seohaeanensis]|uniref:Homoserine O-acetyltransferase n=1 Tax=Bacillus seohaeanensis TaxID=284580 RepID=A0ABW5RL14_9BACI